MANLATKAPNFTVENAKEMSRRAVEARKTKRIREKELLAILQEQARLTEKPAPDEARKQRVLRQIDDYLDDMKGASLKTRLMIGKAVAELWKLVQPTAGVQKHSRSRQQQAPVEPLIPQENLREIKDLSSNQPQS